MGMLAEQLRAIIEGPLGTDKVTEGSVAERVGAIRQNERRQVFGVVVYRDGDDQYFADDRQLALSRREVVEAITKDLAANGRLDEKLSLGALAAMGDQQKEVDAAEAKIGETFKKVAKRYTQALDKMTGAKWRVVSASESIFSLDSDEDPKRAIDIYWEYDPGSQTATIYVEGPGGKQKAYSKQKIGDVSRKNYIDWLSRTLKEEMGGILTTALTEDSLVEGQLGKKLAALDVVIKNQKRHGRSTTIGKGINQVSADEAKWMVSKRIAQWVETRKGEKAVSVDASSKRLWDFRNDLEAQAYESRSDDPRHALIEEIQGIIDEAAVVSYRRRVAKAPPLRVGKPSKPTRVPSGTKVGRLFKDLVRALTRGGDWDAAIKALRHEGVPENHINYAIKYKEVPYVYQEGVEDAANEVEEGNSLDGNILVAGNPYD